MGMGVLVWAWMGVLLLALPLLAPVGRWVGGRVAWGYVAVGAGAGGGPHVRDFNIHDGTNPGEFVPAEDELASFFPYSLAFTGGVRVAVRAFGFQTTPEPPPANESDSLLVTGAGPGGGPHVQVFDVRKGTFGIVNQVASFFAYHPSFTGGVSVAVGDFDDDNDTHHVVTGPGAGGGPHVRIFTVRADGSVVPFAELLAYDASFAGGVWVGAGDLDGDGQDELITGPGPGGGPHVRAFKVSPTGVVTPFVDFFAYAPGFAGGVFVAAGNLDGDALTDELVTGAGSGGGPHVRVWDVSPTGVATEKVGFLAYAPGFLGGVRVAVGTWNSSQIEQIVTGAGPGGGPHVRSFLMGPASTVMAGPVNFFPFPAAFTGGVFVGANDFK
jgi:hypothetical protein